jgi:hypothetical protein
MALPTSYMATLRYPHGTKRVCCWAGYGMQDARQHAELIAARQGHAHDRLPARARAQLEKVPAVPWARPQPCPVCGPMPPRDTPAGSWAGGIASKTW